MLRILVNILLRQARINNAESPETWLLALQTSKFEVLNKQNGQITSTMVNGKSVTIQALPGTSIADLITATELALQLLESGQTRASSRSRAVLG